MSLIDEIPFNLASRKEWKRRGYKLKRGAMRHTYFKKWNGMYFLRFWLYHFNDVECIRGEKARIRRRDFHHKWLESVKKDCE